METDAEQRLLDNDYEGVKYFTNPSYAEAIVGVSSDDRVVYDYQKMVECLMKGGMDETDAIEWIDFNVIRALPCMEPGAPVIFFPLMI